LRETLVFYHYGNIYVSCDDTCEKNDMLIYFIFNGVFIKNNNNFEQNNILTVMVIFLKLLKK